MNYRTVLFIIAVLLAVSIKASKGEIDFETRPEKIKRISDSMSRNNTETIRYYEQ